MKASIYDLSTGRFTGTVLTGPEQFVRDNTPAGHAFIAGAFDPLCNQVNLETGEVVDYQPPSPGPDYEWHAPSKRWIEQMSIRAAKRQRQAVLTRIKELEESQHRRVRELLMRENPELKAIDDEIAQLRGSLTS